MNITLIVGALILMVMGSSPLSFAPMQAHDGVTGDINFRWRKRPNREADKALVEACYMDVPNYKNEKFTEVKEALMRGGNPNFHDKSGFTPLMQEAQRGHVRTTILLLRYGASVNLADTRGNTALIYASSSANWSVEIVTALLKYGALIKHRNKDGRDALYYARNCNNRRIISLLHERLQKSGGSVKRNRHW